MFLIWGISFSQEYKHLTSKNGLPSDHIYRITQDYEGFIWLLTDKGMVKYNGSQFKTFTTKEGLPTNDIWDIRITPDNKIWYFSKASALGYIKNDSVYKYFSQKKEEILYPISINQSKNDISFIDTGKNRLLKDGKWANEKIKANIINHKDVELFPIIHSDISQLEYTSETLFIIDKNNKIVKKTPAPQINKYYIYKGQINDSLYCWISNNKILLFNNNDLKFREIILSNPKKYTRFIYANNQIIFTAEHFLAILQSDYTLKSIPVPKNINTHASFIDKQGNCWIATFSNGVYFLSKNKKQVKRYFLKNKVGRLQLVNNEVWATVFNKGFIKYNDLHKDFNLKIKDASFLYNIVSIDSGKRTFFLSEEKIVSVTKQQKKVYNNYASLIARDILSFKGDLYGFSYFGLNKLHPKTLKVLDSFNQSGIRDIITYKDKLILGTSNGLRELKDGKISQINLINKPILKLIKQNGYLIVCTDGFGAFYTNLDSINKFEESQFLSVQSAFASGNEVYLATNEGVFIYKLSNATYKLLKNITTQEGLYSNLSNDVLVNNNQLFVSSNGGISVLPKNIKDSNLFLDIYFDSVRYDTIPLTNATKIKYTPTSRLSVGIATIDFTEDKPTSFLYRLSPIQKQWVQSASPTIEFLNLQPNNYKLSIKKGQQEKEMTFTIKPQWWQSGIFKISLIVIFALFVGLLSWLISKNIQISKNKKVVREKKLAELQLKALRSQMNPHFVFNSLAAIQYYINQNDLETSDKYLVKFSKLIRRFFELSKDEEILLSEEVKLLTNYLEIEKLRFREKFNFTIVVDPKLDTSKTKIPTMLLQPTVENAVNHGIFNKLGNGNITIEFVKLNENSFQVTILDDGVGYLKTSKEESGKLKSSGVIQNRIYILNQTGNWDVKYHITEVFIDKKDKGTKVTFTITRKK